MNLRTSVAAALTRPVGLLAVTAVFLGAVTSLAAYTDSSTGSTSTVSATAYSYSTTVSADTPWLWWRFNETSGTTATDSSGNSRAGTVSAVGLSRGAEGAILNDTSSAYNFAGTGGCVTANASHANPLPVTLEIWFRTTSTRGGMLIGFDSQPNAPSGTTTMDRQLYLTASGQVAFGWRPSGYSTIVSPGSYNDGDWHVAHAQLSSTATSLYVDGLLVASGGGGSVSTTAYWHVGCGTVSTNFTSAPTTGHLAATLDEAAVYTSTLSAVAIAKRFTAARSREPLGRAIQSTSPWAWWRLGEGSGSTSPDATGNARTLTQSAAGVTASDAGVTAGSVSSRYNGTSGCAVATASQANPTVFSISAWFASTSTSGGSIVGFADSSAASPTGTNRDRHVYLTPDGSVAFGVMSSGSPTVVTTPTGGYADGGWHHVLATLGPNGQRLYLDGALVASSANTAAGAYTGWWRVGCQNITGVWSGAPSSSYLSGRIDEVSVYVHELDARGADQMWRAAGVAPSWNATVAAGSPTLRWRLDDTVPLMMLDSSSTNDNGRTTSGGIVRGSAGIGAGGSAYGFDGSAGCAVGTTVATAPSTFSLESWIRTTTTTGGYIVGNTVLATPTIGDTSANHDRHLYMRDNGQVTFGAGAILTSTRALNDGRWHHLLVSVGSSGTRLYVDGTLDASSALTGGESRTGVWRIGCLNINSGWPGDPTSHYFAGDIDEVAVYPAALTAATARTHYLAGLGDGSMQAVRAMSPVVATWSIDETSGTTISDTSGNGLSLALSASGATLGVAGISGPSRAATFNGTNGCSVATASTTTPTRFTIEAWLRTTSTAGGGIIQASDNPLATSAGTSKDRSIWVRSDGRVSVGVHNGTSTQVVTSTSIVNDGSWHQIVATFTPSAGLKLYIDGASEATLAGFTPRTLTGTYWHLGCFSGSGLPSAPSSDFLNGTLDEVVIHADALDSATIAQRHGLVDQPLVMSRLSLSDRTPTFTWRLEETSGNPQDSSGTRHGTASGSGITRQEPGAVNTGRGWQFNGSSGCIVAASSDANPTDFSVETWFRTDSTSGAGLMAFTNNSSATNGGTTYDRLLYMHNDGKVSFAVHNGGSLSAASSTASYNDGNWHHAVASVGSNGTRLYLDGSLVASIAANTNQNFTGWWHAGCGKYDLWPNAPSSQYLNGHLDDIAVHPYQLSATEVRTHYEAGTYQRSPIVRSDSIVQALAGTGTGTTTGDGGSAASATVASPRGITVDTAGNVYIAESCKIRRVNPAGTISTYAGTGTCGSTGDGGAATSATIYTAYDMAVGPDGSLYFVEFDSHKVRRITAGGTISTIAGTGSSSYSGDGGAATSAGVPFPVGVTVAPDGSIYVASLNRVRRVSTTGTISTIVGNGTGSSTGDGGAATSATVNNPAGMAFLPDGTFLVAENDGCRVRRINASNVISTYAGDGVCTYDGDGGSSSTASFLDPGDLVVDQWGQVYLSDLLGQRIRRISQAGTVSTVLGSGTATTSTVGNKGSASTVNWPFSMALDPAGRLVIAEYLGNVVRRFG